MGDMSFITIAGCLAVIQIILIFTILQISNKLGELIEKTEEQTEAVKDLHNDISELKSELAKQNQKPSAPPQGFRAR